MVCKFLFNRKYTWLMQSSMLWNWWFSLKMRPFDLFINLVPHFWYLKITGYGRTFSFLPLLVLPAICIFRLFINFYLAKKSTTCELGNIRSVISCLVTNSEIPFYFENHLHMGRWGVLCDCIISGEVVKLFFVKVLSVYRRMISTHVPTASIYHLIEQKKGGEENMYWSFSKTFFFLFFLFFLIFCSIMV